jgi:hypothetical protein
MLRRLAVLALAGCVVLHRTLAALLEGGPPFESIDAARRRYPKTEERSSESLRANQRQIFVDPRRARDANPRFLNRALDLLI